MTLRRAAVQVAQTPAAVLRGVHAPEPSKELARSAAARR